MRCVRTWKPRRWCTCSDKWVVIIDIFRLIPLGGLTTAGIEVFGELSLNSSCEHFLMFSALLRYSTARCPVDCYEVTLHTENALHGEKMDVS